MHMVQVSKNKFVNLKKVFSIQFLEGNAGCKIVFIGEHMTSNGYGKMTNRCSSKTFNSKEDAIKALDKILDYDGSMIL